MEQKINQQFFDTIRKAQAAGEPVARYKKAITGRVAVTMIDQFSGMPVDRILSGNLGDPNVILDDISVIMWTDFENEFFRKANRILLERGYLALAEPTEDAVEVSVNEISDEDIMVALNKKYFAVKALLDKFTSPNPAVRMLALAEEMNKPVGTVNKIKERLSELQAIDDGSL